MSAHTQGVGCGGKASANQPMKGDGLTSRHASGPVALDASKGARPVREGLLGVTLNLRLIPRFYLMVLRLLAEEGRPGKTSCFRREAVTNEAGEHQCVQIPSVGFGPKLERAIGVNFPSQVRSTLLASGARNTVTCPAGSKRRLGIRCKSAIVKSSTMKGAKALASECNQRRCRIAKRIERRVREELLCSAPGNHRSMDRWTGPWDSR